MKYIKGFYSVPICCKIITLQFIKEIFKKTNLLLALMVLLAISGGLKMSLKASSIFTSCIRAEDNRRRPGFSAVDEGA